LEHIAIPEDLKDFSLEKHCFFDNSISLDLPDYMTFMTEESLRQHLVGQIDPAVAMSSPHGDATFIFERQGLGASKITVDSFLEQERFIFNRLIPGYAEIGYGTKSINGIKVGCVQYKSNAVDKDMINIFFAFKTVDNIMYGLFTAPFEWSDIWTKIFIRCIETLRVDACTVK